MWADLASWFSSPAGARVIDSAVVPALAIVVAGVLAALIGRSAVRSAISRADRAQAATAVVGLVEAARAAIEADTVRDGRRRAARLRTEADVRVRLLPVKGADRAADWAAARTDELVAAPEERTAGLAEMRDVLVAWARDPGRSRRLFTGRTATAPAAPLPAPPAIEASGDSEPQAPAPTPPTGTAPAEEAVPAWRRTKSGERLQQERAAGRRSDPEPPAPVAPGRPHRADGPPATEPDDDHSPARHSRTVAVEEEPSATPAPTPKWLDDYDDEAHVTQNLDLRTPPPVSASTLRDRAPNSDIVPRP